MSNFSFLNKKWPILAKLGQQSENYLNIDSNATMLKMRMFGENIIDYIEVYFIYLVKLANTESVISAVNPIIEIFHNNESYTFNNNPLFIADLPELLIKEWSR